MLTRKAPLRRSGKPIARSSLRRVSKKRRRQLDEYSKLRKEFLAAHPVCEVWAHDNAWEWIAPATYRRGAVVECPAEHLFVAGAPAATEVHHRDKRVGEKLNDRSDWIAVSRVGHEWIHAHPSEARRRSLLK